MPPFSGQVQIAESEQARALTLDGKSWEIHFLQNADVDDRKAGKFTHRRFVRVTVLEQHTLKDMLDTASTPAENVDERILELASFLDSAKLPFPPNDRFEYWLLDPADNSPLALIFSCSDEELQANFPSKTDWMALPAAVMPVEKTEDEKQNHLPPVNYRLEMMVTERAGRSPKAKWFKREIDDTDRFPPLMIREDWQEQEQYELCQRYIQRQSSRLLMLHGLEAKQRRRLERSAKGQALEVGRFHKLYPEVVDRALMNAILVEAKLRASA